MLIFPGLPYVPGQEQVGPDGDQPAAVQVGGELIHPDRLAEHFFVHGPQHAGVAKVERTVGGGPEQPQGQFDDALPLLKETLERRRIKLGSDHVDTLTSMIDLAHQMGA